jgi:RHS repeat-associated protein
MSGHIDLLSGLWLDDWFASTDSTGSVALLRNALGSTIALVNSAGSIATQDSYEPFGKTAQSGSSTTNPYAFAGRELDPSGLYFMRARYYNPLLSRFISADPGGAGDFMYANDDPVKLIDPLGLYAFSAYGNTVDVALSFTLVFLNYSSSSGFSLVGPNLSIGGGVDITIDGPKSPSLAVGFGVTRNLSVSFPIQDGLRGAPHGVTISIGPSVPISEEPYFISVPVNTSTEIQSGGRPLPSPAPMQIPSFRLPKIQPGAPQGLEISALNPTGLNLDLISIIYTQLGGGFGGGFSGIPVAGSPGL